jgi:3-methyladenine DNA glycosylase AlkD
MNTTVIIHTYTGPLRSKFEASADPVRASGAKAYMRNISEFYGISSPRRREILAELKKESGFPKVAEIDLFMKYAWEQPQREWQYAAMEIMLPLTLKGEFKLMDTAEFMIINKSWWDTVDYIASNIAGQLFQKNHDMIESRIESWLQTENHWLWRTAILFQLKYGHKTDQGLLFGLCERLSGEQDFFIRKAIGWALRQYSKYEPLTVIEFVETHPLSGLSRREALKVIERKRSVARGTL